MRAQVDVLITVSGFTTMPTLSTAVAARFGMRSDLDAYHLGGHGCAGSTLSICLARQLLLAVRPGARRAAHHALALLQGNDLSTRPVTFTPHVRVWLHHWPVV